MKSGLGSAADLSFGGFDSHDNHDVIHEELYFRLADYVGYFWDYAEELGIAERIMLVIGSDFGRTNFIMMGMVRTTGGGLLYHHGKERSLG